MTQRPNVILILVDDMGFADLGITGSEIKTPNLDALANNGVLLTSMYNCARCCPTRASLLTGLYPHNAGIGHMGVDHTRGFCVMIAPQLPRFYAQVAIEH
jgi:arylsulfatase